MTLKPSPPGMRGSIYITYRYVDKDGQEQWGVGNFDGFSTRTGWCWVKISDGRRFLVNASTCRKHTGGMAG